MSIDGEALWEDLAAEDDAVYRRLDDLRHEQANGQSNLISTPALAPDMPVIRGEVPRNSDPANHRPCCAIGREKGDDGRSYGS